MILLIDSANEPSTPSLEGALCSMCKHLKAVYLWASTPVSGGACKSLMALKWGGGGLKALCFESWTCRLCFGNAQWGWQFVYIREADPIAEWNVALAEKEQSTCWFPLIHGRKRCMIKWRLVKKIFISSAKDFFLYDFKWRCKTAYLIKKLSFFRVLH